MPNEDEYSNPLAPAGHDPSRQMDSSSNKALNNDDFRRLLTTPRVGGTAGEVSHGEAAFNSHRSARSGGPSKSSDPNKKYVPGGKKAHFKSKKDTEEAELNRILKNYRDRAKERREVEIKEHADPDVSKLTAGYRAVAHEARMTLDAAERRKQMIQESKYLGGDMEHTHLVKGLDYALLQKVRSEIVTKEKEEEEIEQAYAANKGEREEVEANIKNALAKGMYRILFKDDLCTVNELFAPRRMAYVVELDDESADSDIPTTLMRSRADCPQEQTNTNLTTNDLVIQKLSQVLAYLRTDSKRKKKEKYDTSSHIKGSGANIYDDAGEYIPNQTKKEVYEKTVKKESGKSYFDKPDGDSKSERKRDRRRDKDRPRDKEEVGDKTDRLSQGWAPEDNEADAKAAEDVEDADKKGRSVLDAPEPSGIKLSGIDPGSYAECYPGGFEAYDAADDSDDEADFTKMDMGNKKGPIRRWDFDNEEQYEDWMSRREALPKAAFQYGVKMNDGRKTRKTGGPRTDKDEKLKLDKQWQKISKMLAQDEAPAAKKSRN